MMAPSHASRLTPETKLAPEKSPALGEQAHHGSSAQSGVRRALPGTGRTRCPRNSRQLQDLPARINNKESKRNSSSWAKEQGKRTCQLQPDP